jgi:hypothetical protein
MKAYGGVDLEIHIFFTSPLDGDYLSASRPGRFTLGGRTPRTHWLGGWVDPRDDLDGVEKRKVLILSGLESRSVDQPARSQLLYRLRYPGSVEWIKNKYSVPISRTAKYFSTIKTSVIIV